MSDAPIKYRRLPGRGRRGAGFFSVGGAARSSLWLGPDHLLSVDRLWMNEEFKRFYFQDIQGFAIVETDGRTFWNAVLGCVVLLTLVIFGIIASNSSRSNMVPVIVTGAIFVAVWLVMMLINGLRGPCCVCTLRTAVHIEELPSLKRVARAEKVIALLRPFILNAQEAIPASPAAPPPRQAAIPLSLPVRPPPVAAPGLREESGMFHASFYTLLVLTAALGLSPIHFSQMLLYVFVLALLGLGIVALARQGRSAMPLRLQSFTVVTFVVGIAMIIAGYFAVVYWRFNYLMQHRGTALEPVDLRRLTASNPFMVVIWIIELFFGAAGLILSLPSCLRRAKGPPREAGPA